MKEQPDREAHRAGLGTAPSTGASVLGNMGCTTRQHVGVLLSASLVAL